MYYDVPEEFVKRYDDVYNKFLQLIAEHIRSVGTLRPTEINRLEQMARMGRNIRQIKKDLAKATGKNQQQIQELLDSVANETYSTYHEFYAAKGIEQLPLTDNAPLKRTLDAVIEQTQKNFTNLSNTTVIKELYKECVDKAIMAVNAGYTDYNSAIRDVVQKTALQGDKVEYESGYRRDREAAARMNVLDGIRQINREIAAQVGEEFGADGVEISAHYDCAPDHLPYQGKQYSLAEYNEINASLKRPFTFWNCRHFPMPIILGVSKPAYSEETLRDMARQSTEKIRISGKEKTRYEWTQEQRKIENEVRKLERVKTLARQVGDDRLRRETQKTIREKKDRYDYISESAGITKHEDRMKTSLKLTTNKAYDASFEGKVALEMRPETVFIELEKTEVGRDSFRIIDDARYRVHFLYDDPGEKTQRGESLGNTAWIYMRNCADAHIAAQTLVHEATHILYGVGYCQWAEAVCFAREYMHKHNVTSLPISAKRDIIKKVKQAYGEYHWKKGGYGYARKRRPRQE
ncbi:MAG: hypothetical protein Q4A45_03400 [Clostridia bacterium]|nr:hypothetical protein [Clostridia bacterium]